MLRKEYTLDDFHTEKIIERGTGFWSRWYGVEEYCVNYSSILSTLIVECGKYCKRYASDLFIDWKRIDRELHNREYTGGRYLFGFREDGVDHNAFVLSRFNNECEDISEYFSIWVLDIVANGEDIEMTLGKFEHEKIS